MGGDGDGELEQQLLEFIRGRFLSGDPARELTADTPLLEWGVLDSLRVVMLVNHIRENLGLPFPPASVVPEQLGTVATIAATVRAADQDTSKVSNA